ncbi:hypothetical protein JX265_009179 [Neoarthrinium moseri]|uniref:Uncharacterized protein n=1 Tax=Neoarthrinium moseri TaxID=1658444 RepID=A0A9P9WGP3_9PEZI|nr:uncharacterized protein JN550_011789 [Neoarthrinium moseri]KAI1847751.1 hypothetical protein JX266_006246 [Neoarthrinium moseri]KAI1859978.1 hypothetical protein JN550_011789 [Neoarthrinium moseri]KAI1862465.1 hypothetical protein JX265_009179 [Neoarthrinium moseri]
MANPTKDSDIMTEEAAYDIGRAELKAIKESWWSAKNTLIEALLQAVNDYKTCSNELALRRDRKLQQIYSESPWAGDNLAEQFVIPHPDNGIFPAKGIVFSYKPDSGRSPGAANTSLQSSQVNENDSDATGLEIVVESKELAKPDRAPSPASGLPSEERVVPTDTSAGRRSRPGPARLCPLKTRLPPIKTAEVSKSSYWVFEYRTRHTYAYYIMRCPSDECSSPVFTKNPLRNKRAEQHIRQCNYPFKGERDLVHRYARPVITGRKDRIVTQAWAYKHNKTLLASNEAFLERENVGVD